MVIAVVLYLAGQGTETALRQARDNERNLAASNRELLAIGASLEKRTRHLEIVNRLNERLSAILDLETLLAEVVNQVKENFGYYHTHIYLLNEEKSQLVVAAGTGSAGQEMKAKGHRISEDALTSLVARAARSNEIVRVDNVREAEDWLSNPLLPDTCAEMAVPIVLEDQVVGVLDVQSDEVAGLDEDDAALLRSVASQVAVAIRNARLFTEVETALSETQSAQEQYIEQAWQKVKVVSRGGKYHYVGPDASELAESILLTAKSQALSVNQPTIVSLEGNGYVTAVAKAEMRQAAGQLNNLAALVAPVKLRDKMVGALQLYPANGDQTWTEDDLAVVEAVVDELAQIADGIRLLNESQERAGRERLVSQVSDKMRRAPDMETLMNIAVTELTRVLGPARTFVRLGSEAELGDKP